MKSRLKNTTVIQAKHQINHANEFKCSSNSMRMSSGQQNISPRRITVNGDQKNGFIGKAHVSVTNGYANINNNNNNTNNNNINNISNNANNYYYYYCNSNSNGISLNQINSNGSGNSSTMYKNSKKSHHTDNSETSSDYWLWYAYAFIGFAAIGCYVNGIDGDFVHDDIPAITLNKDVLGTNKIMRTFFNDFWGTPMEDASSHKSYRPLTVLSFRLNYYLFGMKPIWFHLTNILLHAIVCVLFTRVCIIVAGLQDRFAVIAGIIFAVHPIHTEAVTGIVGRADILACIFFLTSLLVYHGSDNVSTWLSIVFGGISMLSKETGITVFLVNLTYDLYRCWPTLKRTIADVQWTQESQQCYRRLSKLLISMGILLTLRLALLQGSFPKFSQQDNPTAYHPSFYVRMLTFSYLAAFNWWLVLCPSSLSHDWQMGSIPLLTSISDARNLLTLWALASTILMIHKSWLDFESQRCAPLLLGIILLILPFLPASNLFVTVGFVVAERVLYIPSLGCVLLVVYGAQMLWETMSKYRSFIILMGILIITVGTCKTITRNRDWYSRECLLRAGLTVLPHNAKMHYNFGNFLKDSKQHDTAKLHYQEALRLWPTYASAHNNLGTLMTNMEKAEEHFRLAILYASSHVNAHFNLGQLYLKKNRTKEAVRMLRRCTDIDATYVQAHKELFRLHHGIRGAQYLERAIKTNPYNYELKYMYGYWLMDNGFPSAAVEMFQNLIQSNVNDTDQIIITNICKCLRKMGQFSRLHLFTSRILVIQRVARGGQPYKIDIYFQNWDIRAELARRAYSYNIENHSTLYPSKSTTETERRTDKLISVDRLSSKENHKNESHSVHIVPHQNHSDQIAAQDYTASAQNPNQNMYQKQYCCIESKAVRTANVISNDKQMDVASTLTLVIDCNRTASPAHNSDARNCDTNGRAMCNCSETNSNRAESSIVMTTTISASSHNVSMKQKNDRSTTALPTTSNKFSHCRRTLKSPLSKTQNTFLSRLLFTDIIDTI